MFGLTPYNSRNQGIQRGMRDLFDMDSIFESYFNGSMMPSMLNSAGNQMKVDIKENENEYVIDAELPGVNKEDINIELKDERLTIAVQRNEVTEEEKDNYIRKERRMSSMARSFWVDNINREDIKAKFENGVLTISLPKAENTKTKSHKIDIN